MKRLYLLLIGFFLCILNGCSKQPSITVNTDEVYRAEFISFNSSGYIFSGSDYDGNLQLCSKDINGDLLWSIDFGLEHSAFNVVNKIIYEEDALYAAGTFYSNTINMLIKSEQNSLSDFDLVNEGSGYSAVLRINYSGCITDLYLLPEFTEMIDFVIDDSGNIFILTSLLGISIASYSNGPPVSATNMFNNTVHENINSHDGVLLSTYNFNSHEANKKWIFLRESDSLYFGYAQIFDATSIELLNDQIFIGGRFAINNGNLTQSLGILEKLENYEYYTKDGIIITADKGLSDFRITYRKPGRITDLEIFNGVLYGCGSYEEKKDDYIGYLFKYDEITSTIETLEKDWNYNNIYKIEASDNQLAVYGQNTDLKDLKGHISTKTTEMTDPAVDCVYILSEEMEIQEILANEDMDNFYFVGDSYLIKGKDNKFYTSINDLKGFNKYLTQVSNIYFYVIILSIGLYFFIDIFILKHIFKRRYRKENQPTKLSDSNKDRDTI